MQSKWINFSLLILLSLMSCSKDEKPATPSIDKGVYVLNQGQFPNGSSAVTYINPQEIVQSDIYSLQNDGNSLGSVAQGMLFVNGKVYISINNGGKVVVVENSTFKLQKEISGLELPRYFETKDNLIYVSQWGTDGFSGSIKIIKDDELFSEISTGGAPEKLVISDGKLYVTMSFGFQYDDRLLIIDLATNQMIKSITLSANPTSILKSRDGTIWVMCQGDFQFGPVPYDDGMLYQIKNDAIVANFRLPNLSSNACFDTDESYIYFTTWNGIYRLNIKGQSHDYDIVYTRNNLNGLAFDPSSNSFFASDPKDYASKGYGYSINSLGAVIDSFSTGIVPAQIFVKQ